MANSQKKAASQPSSKKRASSEWRTNRKIAAKL